MEGWYYIEQGIIGLLFLWACWQLVKQFWPQEQGGCAKGCGKECPAARIKEQLDEIQ